MLFFIRVSIQPILNRKGQDPDQIFGENLGMKILIHGKGRFSGKIFQLDAAFHNLVILFNRPSLVIQIAEDPDRVLLRVNQGGDQNSDFAVVFDADQSQLQRSRIQSHLLALRQGGGVYRQFNGRFRQTGAEKLTDRFPLGAGDAGTEIGVHGKDQLEQPPCRIASVEQNHVARHRV